MRLRMRVSRRLRQLLPPGLAGSVVRMEAGMAWSASPLARLALGAATRRGCIRLALDDALAALLRQRGRDGLPDAQGGQGWSQWQPLGHRQLRFKAVSRSGQVALLDVPHQRLWLLWRESRPARAWRNY